MSTLLFRYPAGRTLVNASLLTLLLLCLLYGAWPVWRAFFPIEIDLNEAWNAYHTQAILTGHALYPGPDEFIANNYPPLYYYLVALLTFFSDDVIAIGRVLSFIATLSITATIGLCIRRLGGGRAAALLGALWFLATMVRYANWYVGMNDPQLPAQALMMLGLCWLLGLDRRRAPEPAILLMVVAGFVKHSLIATPAAAIVLLAQRDKQLALRAVLVGAVAAVLGLALCAALFGANFINQMFFYPRVASLTRGLVQLERLGSVIPALIVWGIWAWYDRTSDAARFTRAFVGLSFASYFIQKSANFVDVNAQFELNAALAIGLGMAFERIAPVSATVHWSAERCRSIMVSALIVGLVVAPGLEPYLILVNPDYRAEFHRNSEIMRSEVKRVAALPWLVYCNIPTVCFRAGKPYAVDTAYVSGLLGTGRISLADLNKALIARGIKFDKIDPRASMGPLQWQLKWGRGSRPKPG